MNLSLQKKVPTNLVMRLRIQINKPMILQRNFKPVGKSLVNMTKEGATYADNVLTQSTVTGIATDKLQEYMYAAELVDVSVDSLTGSMAKQIKSMKSAQKLNPLIVA